MSPQIPLIMITIVGEQVKVTRICAQIEQVTDRKDHTGALGLLADDVGGKFPKIMQAIKSIHDAEGCMPYTLGQYRHEVKAEMLARLAIIKGEAVAERIRKAF